MIKFKELFKKPITYFVLGALVVATSVLCGVLPLIAKPKPRPAITAEQKEFLQAIAQTESAEPEVIDFSYDTTVLSQTQEISEVHYISQNLMVATITNSSDDSSFIYLVETNGQTTTLTQIVSSTDYSFSSLNGNCLVLTNRADRTQALYGTSAHAFVQAAGVYNSITPLSDGYFLLSQVVETGDPDYDDYGYYKDIYIAKISGSSLTICATQNNAFDSFATSNFVAINSVNKFSLYFLTDEGTTEEFTYDNNARGQSIQELIEHGFEPLVQKFKIEQINSTSYHLQLELMGTATHYTYAYNYGDGIYYYNIANYQVSVADCSVTITDDQTNTYSYKTLPNDCYQQTITTPEGKTTTSYFNTEGKKVWTPSFEIIHSFGDTFIATTSTGAALYNQNMEKMVDIKNQTYISVFGDYIFCDYAFEYTIYDKMGNLIVDKCKYISGVVNNKILFGSFELWPAGEDEYTKIWDWKYLDTSTNQTINADNIDADLQSKVNYLKAIICTSDNGYVVTTENQDLQSNNLIYNEITKSFIFFADDKVYSLSQNTTEEYFVYVNENNMTSGLPSNTSGKFNEEISDLMIQAMNPDRKTIYATTSGYSGSFKVTITYTDYWTDPSGWSYGRFSYRKWTATRDSAPKGYVIDKWEIYHINITHEPDKESYSYSGTDYTQNDVWTAAASFSLKPVTITFNFNSENYLFLDDVIETEQISSRVVYCHSTYGKNGALPEPTCSGGYVFDGWSTSATVINDNTRVKNDSIVGRETNSGTWDNHTLYAHWRPLNYTVSFDLNRDMYAGMKGDNPTVVPNNLLETSKEITFASTYNTLPEPTCAAYTFDGWYTSASGGSEVTSETTVSTPSNHTLYAHWAPTSYTITLETPNKYGGNNRYPGWGSVSSPSSTNTSKTYTIEDASLDLSSLVPAVIKNKEPNRHYIFDHWELIITATGWGDARTGTYPYMNIADAKNVTSFGTPYASNGTVLIAMSGNKNAVKYNESGEYTTETETSETETSWAAGQHYGNVTLLAVFKIPIYYLESGQTEANITESTPIIGFRLSNESISWASGSKTISNLPGDLVAGCNQYFTLKFVADPAAGTEHWTPYSPYNTGTESSGWSTIGSDGLWNVSYKNIIYKNNTCFLNYTINNTNTEKTLTIRPQQTSDGSITATSIGTFDAPVYLTFNYNIVKYKAYSNTTTTSGADYGKINYTEHKLLVPTESNRDSNVATYLRKILGASNDDTYHYIIGSASERIENGTIEFDELGTIANNIYPKAVTAIKRINVAFLISGLPADLPSDKKPSIEAEEVDYGTLFSATEAYKEWLSPDATSSTSVYSNDKFNCILFKLKDDKSAVVATPVLEIGDNFYTVSAKIGTDIIGKDELFTEATTNVTVVFSAYQEDAENIISVYTYNNDTSKTVALHKIVGVEKVEIAKIGDYGNKSCLLINQTDPYFPLPDVEFNEGKFSVCGLMITDTPIGDFADLLIISETVKTELNKEDDFPATGTYYIYVVYQRVGNALSNP